MLLAGVEIFSRSQGGTAAAQGALKVSRFVEWRAGFFAASGTKPDTVGFRRDYFGDGGGGGEPAGCGGFTSIATNCPPTTGPYHPTR